MIPLGRQHAGFNVPAPKEEYHYYNKTLMKLSFYIAGSLIFSLLRLNCSFPFVILLRGCQNTSNITV